MRRLAVVATVLLLLAASPASAQPVVDHIHSSTLYRTSDADLAKHSRRLASTSASVITWTEVWENHRADVLRRLRQFRTYAPPRTDVAVSWRRTVWQPRRGWTVRLAHNQRAAFVVLDRRGAVHQRLLVVVAHMPSHVEYGDDWRPGVADRVQTWRTAVATLGRRVPAVRQRWRPDVVIVAADWNVNLRHRVWRQRADLPGLSTTWLRGKLPWRGTHGARRLIDGTMTNARGHAFVLNGDAASDHRPYRERLR